jgi:phenylpropionate dioxygenase-like ring-hydroxylating dioxygenase large terminal subunit
MGTKVSRRDFARTSVAAGAAAAAVALPESLFGATATTKTAETSTARAAGVAAAKRVVLPPQGLAYGGDAASALTEFRDAVAFANTTASGGQNQPPPATGRGRDRTIPGEYYVDEKHFAHDERFIGEHLWLMADHVNRIPTPGDYFVFEYGRGESVIIVRDKAGDVKGYHNVCRHRGSRLARHHDEPAPKDARLSVKQSGAEGNTPVFRCPYHAWTYDIDGTLISAPSGMPADFEMAQHGLHPVHVRTTEGFIFVNFAQGEAPEFESVVKNFAAVGKEYGTADLKIVARVSAPTRANWKLVLENFQECYHCGPAHRPLVTAHPFWDGLKTEDQRARLAQQLDKFIPPRAAGAEGASVMGPPGSGVGGQILGVGILTGTLDGKPAAPLLPTRKEWTHRHRGVGATWSTGALLCYDDHVMAVRFTPRSVKLTDAELLWLVRGDAKSKDYSVERLKALWEITYLEDRWLAENNHQGIESMGYRQGPYAAVETGPRRFVDWYMTEVVASGPRPTSGG